MQKKTQEEKKTAPVARPHVPFKNQNKVKREKQKPRIDTSDALLRYQC